MVPTGFRFNPTDEELIEMLQQKATEAENTVSTPSLSLIVERNVYELEPQHLKWTPNVALNNNERFYFCKRESDSREVLGRGWWKATSHVKTIFGDGQVVGYKRPLTYHRFREFYESKRKDAIKTDWIMHEYSLHSIPTEWRLCKIKYKGKHLVTTEDTKNARYPESTSEAAAAAGSSSTTSSIGSINPMHAPLLLPTFSANDGDSFWPNCMRPPDQMIHEEQQQQIMLAQLWPPNNNSSFDPMLNPSYHQFPNQQQQQDNNLPTDDFTFSDLWSSTWDKYYWL